METLDDKRLFTYMPVWNFDELFEIKGDMDDDEAWLRYMIVGGSARNFKFNDKNCLTYLRITYNFLGSTSPLYYYDDLDGH